MGRLREQFKILVVGLPPGSTSQDLQKLVKPIGNPLGCNMAVDADGRERGFGFVQFADAATQQAAITALDKTAVSGRTLNVRAVEERGGKGDGRNATAGGTRGRPCYDFGRTGKCARGAACKWAHVAPPSDGDSSRRPEWQKKRSLVGGSEGAAERLLHDIPEDYCRKYQFGSCHRGEACRWKHLIWKGAAKPGAAEPSLTASAAGAAGSNAPESKRAKTGVAGGAAGTSSSSSSGGPLPIGGMLAEATAAEQAAELRERLDEREVR